MMVYEVVSTMRWRRYAVVGAAAAMLLAVGCNANDEDPTPTPPADDEDATTVTATLVDLDIELSEETFTAGTYTFVVEQAGEMPHALAIEGPGVSEATTTIPPGGPIEQFTVTLEPGTYELWCPVDDHRDQGMELTIEVT